MKIEYITIDAIKPYERNPRKNDAAVDAVAASIQEFGFQQPIVCDTDGVIIVGHTRLKAAKKLGLKTVPVVYADLPEDKVKAYRLADNKTGELAEWDTELLDLELGDIEMDFEISGFGFDEPRKRAKAENFTDRDEDPLPRLQHNTFDNFDRDFRPEYVGKYGIPVIEPTHTSGAEFMRFCDWKENNDPGDVIAHFYYDDYKFIQAWKEPDFYVDRLRNFKAVISPDFSLYTDFPLALQIMSCYRRQWVGAYWQSIGLDVIPDVIWGEPETFEFCFDGIPKGGTVAVSSVGVKNDKSWNGKEGDLFRRGYDEMLRRLEPETVLFYGKLIDGLGGNIVRIPSYYEQRREALPNGKRKQRD